MQGTGEALIKTPYELLLAGKVTLPPASPGLSPSFVDLVDDPGEDKVTQTSPPVASPYPRHVLSGPPPQEVENRLTTIESVLHMLIARSRDVTDVVPPLSNHVTWEVDQDDDVNGSFDQQAVSPDPIPSPSLSLAVLPNLASIVEEDKDPSLLFDLDRWADLPGWMISPERATAIYKYINKLVIKPWSIRAGLTEGAAGAMKGELRAKVAIKYHALKDFADSIRLLLADFASQRQPINPALIAPPLRALIRAYLLHTRGEDFCQEL